MLSILSNRTYRHLFAAQVIALVGTGLLTVALGLLVEDEQVVEHRHEGLRGRDRRFLVKRRARRIVPMVDAQRSPGFLGQRRRDGQGGQPPDQQAKHAG